MCLRIAWLQIKSPSAQLRCCLEVASLERNHAQQMPSSSVIRLAIQNLPADQLSFLQTSRLQMTNSQRKSVGNGFYREIMGKTAHARQRASHACRSTVRKSLA